MSEAGLIARRSTYEAAAREERFIVPLLRDAIAGALARHAPPAGARVLDAGCGEQPFRAALERAGLRYHSLDVQQNAAGTVEFLGTLDGDLPNSLPRESFSLVLCTEVLEHVARWDRAFANLASLLARGGRVILTSPFVYPLHEEPHDFWRPTPYAVRDAAAAHGLRVIDERRLGDSWDVLGTILAATWTYPADGRLGARLRAAVARRAHAWLWRALDTGSLRSYVALRGPWFLSTLAVLERA
jgi:SAM-dependent methyltransferase